jgi:heme exporter protein B
LLFSFAVGPNAVALREHAAAYLWLTLLLSSTLLLDRSMRIEVESGALYTMLLAPVSRAGLFYGKALANTIQLMILAAISIPLIYIICDASLVEPLGWVLLTAVLGSAGLAAPGTMYSAMTARMTGKQLLLPLLLFPLVVPVIVAAVKATSLAMLGDPMDQIGSWLTLLVCFDLVYWSLCGVLFGRVIEA